MYMELLNIYMNYTQIFLLVKEKTASPALKFLRLHFKRKENEDLEWSKDRIRMRLTHFRV